MIVHHFKWRNGCHSSKCRNDLFHSGQPTFREKFATSTEKRSQQSLYFLQELFTIRGCEESSVSATRGAPMGTVGGGWARPQSGGGGLGVI